MKYYTGVGSRETPNEVLTEMETLARVFAKVGWTLRSGAAPGADTAFERGCDSENGLKEIFLPWRRFNKSLSMLYPPKLEAYNIAKSVNLGHFDYLKPTIQHLLARNAHQVEGWELNQKSNLLVCWTPDGCRNIEERTKQSGGTGTAIALACRVGVPVYNLYHEEDLHRLLDKINEYRVS